MQPRKFRRYDAPLKIQFKWGYDAFKKGGKYRYIGGKKMFTELLSIFW